MKFKARSKYGNRKVKEDGHAFDSKAEHLRYQALKILQRGNHIKRLCIHPRFEIIPGFVHEGKKIRAVFYEADFSYYDNYIATEVVEDVKGMRTALFNIKEKLFLRLYGNKIKFIVKGVKQNGHSH